MVNRAAWRSEEAAKAVVTSKLSEACLEIELWLRSACVLTGGEAGGAGKGEDVAPEEVVRGEEYDEPEHQLRERGGARSARGAAAGSAAERPGVPAQRQRGACCSGVARTTGTR